MSAAAAARSVVCYDVRLACRHKYTARRRRRVVWPLATPVTYMCAAKVLSLIKKCLSRDRQMEECCCVQSSSCGGHVYRSSPHAPDHWSYWQTVRCGESRTKHVSLRFVYPSKMFQSLPVTIKQCLCFDALLRLLLIVFRATVLALVEYHLPHPSSSCQLPGSPCQPTLGPQYYTSDVVKNNFWKWIHMFYASSHYNHSRIHDSPLPWPCRLVQFSQFLLT